MITAIIEFGGVEYPCRMVKDNQGEYLIIGSTALLDALHPGSFEDENEEFTSKEASDIYDEIFSSPMSVPLPCPTKSWWRS